MTHWPRTTIVVILRTLVLGACGVASTFLLMSGYESVYNRSLPFVHTLDPINLTAFSPTFSLKVSSYNDKSLLGSFGRPQTLKLPDRSVRFTIAAPVQQDKSVWLSRANVLHMLIPAKPRDGNIGVAFMYCRSSFRTINQRNMPASGSNIFVDTDKNWRYVYKVSSTKVYSDSVPYIPNDTGESGNLVIACNDQGLRQNIIVEAKLLSVQGVGQ
jgi:hypothetical protein